MSPYDETSLSWGLSYRAPTIEEPLKISSIKEAQSVIQECKELGKEFLEPFQSILDATDPNFVSRLAARDKQTFNQDLLLGPAIFIGDSNHAVTPFSGYGAGLAMKDGWDLATQLCGSQNLEEAVKSYDAISIPRATKVLKESRQRIDISHATGFNYCLNRGLLSFGGLFLGSRML